MKVNELILFLKHLDPEKQTLLHFYEKGKEAYGIFTYGGDSISDKDIEIKDIGVMDSYIFQDIFDEDLI